MKMTVIAAVIIFLYIILPFCQHTRCRYIARQTFAALFRQQIIKFRHTVPTFSLLSSLYSDKAYFSILNCLILIRVILYKRPISSLLVACRQSEYEIGAGQDAERG